MYKEAYIRQLIDRFMDGTTTVGEERQIAQWFASHPQVPADLEDYRQMFAYFAQGMPLGAADSPEASPVLHPVSRRWSVSRWVGTLAAACAVVALVMALWPVAPLADVAEGVAAPVALQADTVVGGVEGKAQPVAADSTTSPTRRPRPAYHKYKYQPAPPRPLMAQSVALPDVDSLPQALSAHIAQQVTEAQRADDELYERALAVGTLLGEVALGNAMALAEEEVY